MYVKKQKMKPTIITMKNVNINSSINLKDMQLGLSVKTLCF